MPRCYLIYCTTWWISFSVTWWISFSVKISCGILLVPDVSLISEHFHSVFSLLYNMFSLGVCVCICRNACPIVVSDKTYYYIFMCFYYTYIYSFIFIIYNTLNPFRGIGWGGQEPENICSFNVQEPEGIIIIVIMSRNITFIYYIFQSVFKKCFLEI